MSVPPKTHIFFTKRSNIINITTAQIIDTPAKWHAASRVYTEKVASM